MQTQIRNEEVEHENCVSFIFNYVSDQQFSLIFTIIYVMQYCLNKTFVEKLLTPDDNKYFLQ